MKDTRIYRQMYNRCQLGNLAANNQLYASQLRMKNEKLKVEGLRLKRLDSPCGSPAFFCYTDITESSERFA